MRIAHFMDRVPCGGIGTVVDLIHRGTIAAGHESHVITGGRDEGWEDWLLSSPDWNEDLGFPDEITVFWKWRYRRRFCEALSRHLVALAPDVIHVHKVPVLIMIEPVLRRLGIPSVLTVHGIVKGFAGGGAGNFWNRHAFRGALAGSRCRCVAVSASAARCVEEGLGLAPGRFKVQGNPIDEGRFSGRAPVLSPPRSILMLSRLVRMKRIQTAVRALAVLDDKPEFRLRVAGSGPMQEELEALADSLSLTARVEFLGARRDVPDLLHAAGVVWHLSNSEGGPMVALEAMAARVPVVVTDVPGSGELVQHEVNGLVVPLSSPPAVAAATRRLWQDEGLRQRVIEGGLATVVRHGVARVAAEYVEHYKAAVSEHHARY